MIRGHAPTLGCIKHGGRKSRPGAATSREGKVFPANFEYHRLGSVDEAIELLGEHGEDGRALAGGHSLIPMMKLRFAQPMVSSAVGAAVAGLPLMCGPMSLLHGSAQGAATSPSVMPGPLGRAK
ncbi:MAG: FAD binding domain-containing protein [Rhodospirillales bacterium]|nr:FAD binding domain-containing protein [Rhodospirillales bacterium]